MKKIIKEPKRVELSQEEIEKLQAKIQGTNLSDKDQELLVKMLQGFVWLNKMLDAKKLSMRKLARLFGFKTEKKKRDKDDKEPPQSGTGGSGKDKKKGHGRNGHDKYTGAKREYYAHEELKPGDRCPACDRGNLYEIDSGVFINIKGAPPLHATVHEAQKLRCATCGKIFTANVPQEVRKQKFDETADVMIGLSKYGKGMPFYRLDKWQKFLGVPLPAGTQWGRVEHLASSMRPIYHQLIKEAGTGQIAYIDDTGNRILDLKKKLKEEKSKRTGIYTTGIVSKVKDKTINLFFTGNRHAGENFDRILETRPDDLPPMIKMSDALPSNNAKTALTTDCLCMTHGRRNFKDAEDDKNDISEKCNHVIHLMGKIYHNDNIAKLRKLTDEERLKFHQRKSGPVVKKLRHWMLKMFYLKKVEPNDPTGQAIQYMLNHWKGLTQFLRVPGAPIDNTECERLLKKAILHRKNSLFFKTTLGAYVGDIIMSLIQTCVSAGKNPFEYLLALHRNRKEVFRSPEKFLPWNFEGNLSGYQVA
ncbi:MAG: IS66 family transposase [Desulfobacterales bacterium]|nr:IS66 family transposase [Desulfobacterales bacterium]